jgi:hypothetical protein
LTIPLNAFINAQDRVNKYPLKKDDLLLGGLKAGDSSGLRMTAEKGFGMRGIYVLVGRFRLWLFVFVSRRLFRRLLMAEND